MLKALKHLLDIRRHSQMHFSARVVPLDGKPAISFAVPITRTLIILLYRVQEVLRKIVYDKRELDGARLVRPQSRHYLALCVALISQAICQEFLCYYPCLQDTIHFLLNLTIYEAVWGHNLPKIVLLDYIAGHV